MGAASTVDPLALARLRQRTAALTERHRALVERYAGRPPILRRLESMRFELAELEWRLEELEAARF